MAGKPVAFDRRSAGQIATATRLTLSRTSRKRHTQRARSDTKRPKLFGVLLGDLAAATNPYDGQATATLKVIGPDPANPGNTKLTDRTETVVNRYMNVAFSAGDLIDVEWREFEYRPSAADCPS
jgi:hypothetical protein